jgi:hypothetical protein
MWATKIHASAEATDASQPLANLRHLPSHAKVRSTTQRRGKTSNRLAMGLTISIVQVPRRPRAPGVFGLGDRDVASVSACHGQRHPIDAEPVPRPRARRGGSASRQRDDRGLGGCRYPAGKVGLSTPRTTASWRPWPAPTSSAERCSTRSIPARTAARADGSC